MDGIIIVNKEKGYTSHDVVAKLRGILKQKKIGHTGTLDPDATGVLPICIGKATKLCGLLTDKDKTYQVICRLGISTDTQDISGSIVNKREVISSESEIRSVIDSFQGGYDQIPPMYSALKVGGRKLYELAREGKEVERKTRSVSIYSILILEINLQMNIIEMEVSCSKGTYIRTLCHDIGEKLGCGACVQELKRTLVSSFVIEQSLTIDEIRDMQMNGRIDEITLAIDSMFDMYPAVQVLEEFSKFIYNGNRFIAENLVEEWMTEEPTKVRVYDYHNKFIALYEYKPEEVKFYPVQMF